MSFSDKIKGFFQRSQPDPVTSTRPFPVPPEFEYVRSLFDLRAIAGESALPVEDKAPLWITDPMVRQAWNLQVKPTVENLIWCWDNESTIQKCAKLLHETILGGGIDFVDRKGESLKDRSDERSWFEGLYDVFPLQEYVEVSIENQTIFGNQLWVPKFDESGEEFESLHPIDWTTVKVYRHPITGFQMFVQEVTLPIDSDLVKVGLNNVITGVISEEDWKKLDPRYMASKMSGAITHYFQLFSDQVVYLKIGSRGYPVGVSPMAAVVSTIVRKRLLEFYMTRGAEIWGSPILTLRTGIGMPPENLLSLMRRPDDWANYQKRIKDGADMLVKYRQFGTFSLAGDQELKAEFPGRGAMDYVRALEYLSREVAGSLLASTALFEARGTELATSRTIKSVWELAVDGSRRRLEGGLRQLHRMVAEKSGKKVPEGCGVKFRKMEIPEELLFRIFEQTRKRTERAEPEKPRKQNGDDED